MIDLDIKKVNTYERGGVIYIDSTLADLGRVRFSTKLKATKANFAKVLLESSEYIFKYLRGDEAQNARRYSLGDIADRFLAEQCGHLKHQSLLKYQGHIKDLKAHFGNKDIRLLSQEELNEYATNNARQGYKVHFLNRLIAFVKDENLTNHLKSLKVAKRAQKASVIAPLEKQEVKMLLDSLESSEFKAFLTLAIFSGMRTGELLALQWQDMDFKNNKILVNKSKEQKGGAISSTKTHKARYIDMLEIIKREFMRWNVAKNPQDYIFNLDSNALRAKWHNALENCNLAKRHLYQTRHTFATMMLRELEEPLWISAMLGHKSLATTMEHYVKYYPTKTKRAQFVDSFFNGSEVQDV